MKNFLKGDFLTHILINILVIIIIGAVDMLLTPKALENIRKINS